MPFTFKNKQKAVALFFMVGLFLLVVLGVLIAKQSDLITSKLKYYTIFTDAHGFSGGGTNITYKGFKIGRITSLSLTEENRIQANLYIFKSYERLLRSDSVLKVQTSLLGTSSLVLMTFDSIPAIPVEENEEEQTPNETPNINIEEKETEALGMIKERFGTTRKMLLSSDMPKGQKILREKAATTIAGDELTDKIALLLDDVHTLKPELESTLVNISKSMEHMSVILASFRGSGRTPMGESLLSILRNTSETSKNVKELSAALNSPDNSVGSIARDNGALAKQLEEVLSNLEVLSKDLKTFSASTLGDKEKMERLVRLLDENLVETKILVKGMQKVFPYRGEK